MVAPNLLLLTCYPWLPMAYKTEGRSHFSARPTGPCPSTLSRGRWGGGCRIHGSPAQSPGPGERQDEAFRAAEADARRPATHISHQGDVPPGPQLRAQQLLLCTPLWPTKKVPDNPNPLRGY